ncbi:hypothetical protein [Pantoea sp. 18069]|uniref:hypothetical protein n=1 Tax=Pantoea sp. 18069 TaxID=2681415 RepID=UPI001F24927C|nr:hypothetical protein [Pantoea sp. 18069]
MDMTPLTHAAITAAAQLAVGAGTGNWWLGGILGACWFAAREHTQAEYRWIEAFGQGKRKNMPWWGGFDPRAWSPGSLLDGLVPAISAAILWASIPRLPTSL